MYWSNFRLTHFRIWSGKENLCNYKLLKLCIYFYHYFQRFLSVFPFLLTKTRNKLCIIVGWNICCWQHKYYIWSSVLLLLLKEEICLLIKWRKKLEFIFLSFVNFHLCLLRTRLNILFFLKGKKKFFFKIYLSENINKFIYTIFCLKYSLTTFIKALKIIVYNCRVLRE